MAALRGSDPANESKVATDRKIKSVILRIMYIKPLQALQLLMKKEKP